MAVDLKRALAKLDRPPSGHNWVRFVRDTKPRTTSSILAFVKGVPPFTYQVGSTAIRDQLIFGIGLDAAVSVTQRGGAPAGRQQNKELVEAFFEYDRTRKYPIGTCIEFERQWFRISRDILVPVSPLAILREHGRFVPIFLCGWSDLALDEGQRRLLMTIYEDAFLSLTDFQKSPAEFLFFPKVADGEGKRRVPEVWQRGDYRILTGAELDEHVRRFLDAREEARAILLAAEAEESRRRKEEAQRLDETDSPDDLFAERDPDKKR